jgi:hypothetical protein
VPYSASDAPSSSPRRAVYYITAFPNLASSSRSTASRLTFGNDGMIAFEARCGAHVNEVHATAVAEGRSDEGAPGPRGENDEASYCTYSCASEGNRFLVFHFGPNEI